MPRSQRIQLMWITCVLWVIAIVLAGGSAVMTLAPIIALVWFLAAIFLGATTTQFVVELAFAATLGILSQVTEGPGFLLISGTVLPFVSLIQG